MQRLILGILALLFLTAGLLAQYSLKGTGGDMTLASMGIRIGAVLGAFWLAYHEMHALPRVLMVFVVASAAVVVVRPKLYPFAALVIIAIMILRALERKKPNKG